MPQYGEDVTTHWIEPGSILGQQTSGIPDLQLDVANLAGRAAQRGDLVVRLAALVQQVFRNSATRDERLLEPVHIEEVEDFFQRQGLGASARAIQGAGDERSVHADDSGNELRVELGR